MENTILKNPVVASGLAFAFTAVATMSFLAETNNAYADTIRILALGASNANGRGVSTSEAWPTQLERLLHAKGYDVVVSVNAVNGDTSSGVLSRTSGISSGTRVVIFDTGGDNDRKRGRTEGEINANKARIIRAIRAHGAAPIIAPYQRVVGRMNTGGSGYQGDGHHLTAASHARIAAVLLPRVIAAIRTTTH